MKKYCAILLSVCLFTATPFAAAETKPNPMEDLLVKMSPEQKVPLAKLMIAKADKEFQNQMDQHELIEKANILYESNNTVNYRFVIRNNPEITEITGDKQQKQLFSEFMSTALRTHLCTNHNQDLNQIALLGIENLRIELKTSSSSLMNTVFPIKDCINQSK